MKMLKNIRNFVVGIDVVAVVIVAIDIFLCQVGRFAMTYHLGPVGPEVVGFPLEFVGLFWFIAVVSLAILIFKLTKFLIVYVTALGGMIVAYYSDRKPVE